ncbi:MAG: VOC family protein [Bellilinea sp.]|jgi:predicted 3-demethylubiquinone-9 3-methyltransferase (glyoxalase superfamily)
MPKITPSLWFNDNAEEAINFYTSVFKNAKVLSVSRYTDAGPLPAGTFLTGVFQLEGQEFMAINGGPYFTFNPAISFAVDCKTQEEVDYFWDKLSEGGATEQCGWLRHKFGVSWQIIPSILGELMQDKDRVKAARVTEAMLKMTKLDIAALKKAYDGS